MSVELDFSQCLEQLGIAYYLPTRQLPGAKASPVLVSVVDAVADPVVDAVVDPVASPASLHSSASIISALNASSSDTPPAEVVPVSPFPSSPVKMPVADTVSALFDTTPAQVAKKSLTPVASLEVSQELTVRLYAWRVGPLMVIDSSSPVSALPTERLLMNILLALNIKLAQLPQADDLRWPLVKNNHDKTRQPFLQAADMVQAYVIAQAERAPLKAVLTMGELACQLVLADKSAWHPEGACANFGQVPVYSVPSLEQLLLEPHQKAATWACIKPLALADE